MSKTIIVRETKETIFNLFPHLAKKIIIETDTELAMFRSGAKLYKCKRNGDWKISGYAMNGSDTIKAINELLMSKPY